MPQRLIVVVAVVAILYALGYFFGDDRAADVRREYDQPGNLISESQHDSEGRPHGTVTLFAPDGRVASVTRFYHGSWVSHRGYNADGTVTDK